MHTHIHTYIRAHTCSKHLLLYPDSTTDPESFDEITGLNSAHRLRCKIKSTIWCVFGYVTYYLRHHGSLSGPMWWPCRHRQSWMNGLPRLLHGVTRLVTKMTLFWVGFLIPTIRTTCGSSGQGFGTILCIGYCLVWIEACSIEFVTVIFRLDTLRGTVVWYRVIFNGLCKLTVIQGNQNWSLQVFTLVNQQVHVF